MRFVDHTNREYDGWFVVGLAGSKGKRRWKCRHIACGTEKDILIYQFQSNDGVRCPKCDKLSAVATVIYRLWKNLRFGAKQRGFEFLITREFMLELLHRQNFKCALTGLPLQLAETVEAHEKGRNTTASLDRKDSTRGYTPDNVQWVHKDINRMKSNLSEERFRELCRLVAQMPTPPPRIALSPAA